MTRTILFLLCCYSAPLLAQTCQDNITSTAPDGRYTDHGDGTVTDTTTSLMWKRCSEGQSGSNCSGTANTSTWQEALQIPANINTQGGFAGYSDWRLPNLKELASLIEERCYNPAINISYFPSLPTSSSSAYWSSTPTPRYLSDAWGVLFNHGNDNYGSRTSRTYVRLVRTGQ